MALYTFLLFDPSAALVTTVTSRSICIDELEVVLTLAMSGVPDLMEDGIASAGESARMRLAVF